MASKSSASGPRSRPLTRATVSRAAAGNAPAPWHAPHIAPVIAAIVSQSPPRDAARRQASQGSPGMAAAAANAAGTDSWVARLVPTSRYTVSITWCWGSPATRPVAQAIRAATSAPATQCPRLAALAAAATARPIATGSGSPSMPALTAAATAAAPASATPVLWVSRLAATTRSSSSRGSREEVAIPTGATRMAAPFVTPRLPASAMSVPPASAARACLVDGPSRSSEPRARIDSSQASRPRASAAASTCPPPATTSRASSTACSVSSVTDPAGSPAASGCPSAPGWNPLITAPYLATISARGSDWVGMPRASPSASPYSAPSARDRFSCITQRPPTPGSLAPVAFVTDRPRCARVTTFPSPPTRPVTGLPDRLGRPCLAEDAGHGDHLHERPVEAHDVQRLGVALVVYSGAGIGDDPHRGPGVGRRQGGGQHAAVGGHPGQHQRPVAGPGRKFRAPLAERGRVHRGPGHRGKRAGEFVDRRVRWLKRERPLVVVLSPGALRDRGGDEPGEDDPRAERLGQAADRVHDLGEPRGEPGAAGLAEHPLHVDHREAGRLPGAACPGAARSRVIGPGLAGHAFAGSGSTGTASCARTLARPNAKVATNPSASATSTPRLANAQAPSLP